jgi:hypothetical protein
LKLHSPSRVKRSKSGKAGAKLKVIAVRAEYTPAVLYLPFE